MREELQKVYYCDHCKRHRLTKRQIVAHERWCQCWGCQRHRWHPDFRACAVLGLFTTARKPIGRTIIKAPPVACPHRVPFQVEELEWLVNDNIDASEEEFHV